MPLRIQVKKRGLIRSFVILISGTASAQLITALSLPIVTRLYSPEMIGIISIFLAFFNFWNTTLTWRYEGALLICQNELEAYHVFRLGSALTFFMAFVGMIVLHILIEFSLLGFEELPKWTPIIALFSLLGFGLFMMYRSWALRLQLVPTISLATISRSAANSFARVIAGIFGAGVLGLFIAEILGSWSALISIRTKIRKKIKAIPKWSYSRLRLVFSKYIKYAKYEMPSAILNQLSLALPVPIIASLYGVKAAGLYGLARLVYAIPNNQIGRSIGDIFHMEIGKLIRRKEMKKGFKLFIKLSFVLVFAAIFIFSLAVLFAPLLTEFIFGSEWRDMGQIIVLISPWMCASLIAGSMSRVLSALQKQEWKLIYDTLALVIVLLVFSIAKFNELELIGFIEILSYSMVFAYFIYYLIIYFCLRNAVNQEKNIANNL
ncbi:MAG: oligosaccharide flippase family protein [Idiomarina sp.]|nr:oligosaccharide flippase family protein [Idiomarina sp.]